MGCGWLGLPLGKALVKQGYKVMGSTTTLSKVGKLKDAGIKPYVLELKHGHISGDIQNFLKNCEILIINIPPKLRNAETSHYLDNLQTLAKAAKNSVEKVIFISSTSVYKESSEIPIVKETVEFLDDGHNARILIEAERIFQELTSDATTILRLGGLLGGNRHPAKYLSGKELKNPAAPVNLVHRQDCIQVIKTVIAQAAFGNIFNIVFPEYPFRMEYYSSICDRLNLPKPLISESSENIGKQVDSTKVQKQLNFQFNHSIG